MGKLEMAGRVLSGGGIRLRALWGRVGWAGWGRAGCGVAGQVVGRRAGWVGGWAGVGQLQRAIIQPERMYVTAE